MLAGELPALEVERIAIAVVRRIPEDADATVVLRPAHLAIVRDVAPNEVAPLRAPGRALGPQETGRRLIAALACTMALNCGSTAMMSGSEKQVVGAPSGPKLTVDGGAAAPVCAAAPPTPSAIAPAPAANAWTSVRRDNHVLVLQVCHEYLHDERRRPIDPTPHSQPDQSRTTYPFTAELVVKEVSWIRKNSRTEFCVCRQRSSFGSLCRCQLSSQRCLLLCLTRRAARARTLPAAG
jgi:hypothetical protein